jgi:hypothetical protein
MLQPSAAARCSAITPPAVCIRVDNARTTHPPRPYPPHSEVLPFFSPAACCSQCLIPAPAPISGQVPVGAPCSSLFSGSSSEWFLFATVLIRDDSHSGRFLFGHPLLVLPLPTLVESPLGSTHLVQVLQHPASSSRRHISFFLWSRPGFSPSPAHSLRILNCQMLWPPSSRRFLP